MTCQLNFGFFFLFPERLGLLSSGLFVSLVAHNLDNIQTLGSRSYLVWQCIAQLLYLKLITLLLSPSRLTLFRRQCSRHVLGSTVPARSTTSIAVTADSPRYPRRSIATSGCSKSCSSISTSYSSTTNRSSLGLWKGEASQANTAEALCLGWYRELSRHVRESSKTVRVARWYLGNPISWICLETANHIFLPSKRILFHCGSGEGSTAGLLAIFKLQVVQVLN